MTELLIYSAKVSVCITILYLPYILVLRKDTNFIFNRGYLLSSLMLSVLIPMLYFKNVNVGLPPTASIMLQEIQVGGASEVIQPEGLSVMRILIIAYLLGAIFMSARIISMFKTIVMIYQRSRTVIVKGVKVRMCKDAIVPFSFLGAIFISEDNIQDDDLDHIIMHEQAHVRQIHSTDIILSELFCLFTWYNPVSWMMRSALKETHEYIADSEVTGRSSGLIEYFMLLTKNMVGMQPGLANNFNKSLTLKRLIMMKKQRSGKLSRLKVFSAAPLIAFLIIIFSCGRNQSEASSQNYADSIKQIKEDTAIDKMPEFPGGSEAMTKYIIDNVKYPADAKKEGIQGKVIVSFMVTKSGKLDDVKVEQKVNDLLDAEAIRVVKAMPNWTPGEVKGSKVDVEMKLPIQFKLS